MKILLLGLGRANLCVAKYLLEKGDDVYLYEENMVTLNEEATQLVKSGELREFKDISYDLIVSSPGFSEAKPIVKHFRARGIEIIDETEFTFQRLNNPNIIAVTGTNGKSTTVALISEILTASGIKNFLGGNIAPGQPFSASLFQEPYPYYVLEMSSFQLARVKRFHPHIAILTNIAIDHLNWHRDLKDYVNAKKRIFMNQTHQDFAVLNYEDEIARTLSSTLNAKVILFGKDCHSGAWLNGMLHFQEEKIIAVNEIPLPGIHNQLNVLAAIATAKILNVVNQHIVNGIKTFKSLPHRLEDVAVIGGIRYINNSMSTNEASAIASFQSIAGNKIVIIGGREKGDRCKNYLDLLVDEAKGIVILGENADYIANILKSKHYENYAIAQDMNEAVTKAKEFAQKGDIIMLNPGFASFGNFRDFQERGEAFKNAITEH